MTDLEERKKKIGKMHGILFEMLCMFDDFCSENKIVYFLSGGTCLGAVRHHGFIPWDDDVDIFMPRKEYERFIVAFTKSHPDNYEIGALEIDPEWKTKHIRVWDTRTKLIFKNISVNEIGVFMDILPIDGLPKNRLRRKLHYKYNQIIGALGNSCIRTEFRSGETHVGIKKVLGFFTKHMDSRFFFKWMHKNAAKYDFDTSEYVGCITPHHYGERETNKKEVFSKATYLDFCGRKFPVPIGYIQYLKNLYGDYMIIPEGAEEQGYTHLDSWDLFVY